MSSDVVGVGQDQLVTADLRAQTRSAQNAASGDHVERRTQSRGANECCRVRLLDDVPHLLQNGCRFAHSGNALCMHRVVEKHILDQLANAQDARFCAKLLDERPNRRGHCVDVARHGASDRIQYASCVAH
jgi:hypothetical protein